MRPTMTAMFSFRYPAVVVASGLALGILNGRGFPVGTPLLALLILASLIALLALFFARKPQYYIIPLAIFVFVWGWFRGTVLYHSYPMDDIGRTPDSSEKVRFFAQIVKWPEIKPNKTFLICRVDSLLLRDSIYTASGLILVTIRRETTRFAWGDRVSFIGITSKPHGGGYPGRFSYARYLSDKGIRKVVAIGNPAEMMIEANRFAPFGSIVSDTRGWLVRALYRNLPESAAALAAGFLIGETRDVDPEVYQSFRRTGTMHLLAVSGSNVALVLVVLGIFLRFLPLSRIPRTLLLLAAIILFSHLSYNQPSVVRASVMAGLLLISRIFYRRVDYNNIIAAAAVIILAVDPAQLFDVGFELSFAVTWALVLFIPRLYAVLNQRLMPQAIRYLILLFSSSLIATLVAAPITGFYFGDISTLAVASNLLIVPLVSAAVVGILLLLAAAMIYDPAAAGIGFVLGHLLGTINDLVAWFGEWPGALLTVRSVSPVMVFAALGTISLLFFSIASKTARRWLVFSILLVTLAATGKKLAMGSDSRSKLMMINTGLAQVIHLDYAGGLLIYRQRRQSDFDDFSANLIPYLRQYSRRLPQIFVLMEPRHRATEKIENAVMNYPEIKLREITIADQSPEISIFSSESAEEIAPESSGRLRLQSASAKLEIGDSIQFFFGSSSDYIRERARFQGGTISVVLAEDDSDLGEVASADKSTHTFIMLTHSIEKYDLKELPQNEKALKWRDYHLIVPGENLSHLLKW